MNWLSDHLYLFMLAVPIVVVAYLPFKKLPEGKSLNWIRISIATAALIAWALAFIPGAGLVVRFVETLFAVVAMAVTIPMGYYD